jgi:paraquat-inducible protein A
VPKAPPPGKIRCRRCDAVLHHHGTDIMQTPLALAVTALLLFTVANSFPLLEFRFQGQSEDAYLLGGIRALFAQDRPLLALTVLLTIALAPALHIGLLLYVYGPLAFDKRPAGYGKALRLLQAVLPWSMLEIFLLGMIVASVKLAEQATILPGPAAWALGALTVALTAAATQVHPETLWNRTA